MGSEVSPSVFISFNGVSAVSLGRETERIGGEGTSDVLPDKEERRGGRRGKRRGVIRC